MQSEVGHIKTGSYESVRKGRLESREGVGRLGSGVQVGWSCNGAIGGQGVGEATRMGGPKRREGRTLTKKRQPDCR